jgi:hypothetical protein
VAITLKDLMDGITLSMLELNTIFMANVENLFSSSTVREYFAS